MCACRCLFAVCVRANVCECECKGVLCKCNCSLARTPWMLAQNKLPYPTNMKKSKSGPKIATTPPAHPISVSDLSPEALNAADCQTELQALQSSVVPGESVQKRHMCRLFLESFCQSSPSCHSKLLWEIPATNVSSKGHMSMCNLFLTCTRSQGRNCAWSCDQSVITGACRCMTWCRCLFTFFTKYAHLANFFLWIKYAPTRTCRLKYASLPVKFCTTIFNFTRPLSRGWHCCQEAVQRLFPELGGLVTYKYVRR